MEALMAWFRQLNLTPLLEILVTAAASWLCISFHEMCHGLTALYLGDPTAKNAGRISLNPLRHIDPVVNKGRNVILNIS